MSGIKQYKNILLPLAMLAMAFYAVASQFWGAASTGSADWRVSGVYTVLSAWGVPLWTAGIGIAYLSGGSGCSVSFIMKKRLIPALVGCLVWWMISALLMMKYTRPNETDFDTFFECMGKALNSPCNARLLQLAAVFFAFYPLLRRIADSEKLTGYAVAVFLVFTAVIPAIEYIPFVNYVNLFLKQINWGFFTSYGLYLFLGIWLLRRPFEWHERAVIYSLGVLSTVAMYCCTVFMTEGDKGFSHKLTGEDSPLAVLQVAALIVLVKYTAGRGGRLLRLPATETAACSAYVFVPMLCTAQYFLGKTLPFNIGITALQIPAEALLYALFAAVTAALIRKLPLISYFSR